MVISSIKNKMKKACIFILGVSLTFGSMGQGVMAGAGGEMGPFGGLSEGSNLPFTINKDFGISDTTYEYEEVVFISGEPVEFSGTITVEIDDEDIMDTAEGTYDEVYEIEASNAETGATLEKTIEFSTYYKIYEGEYKNQIVRNSVMTDWEETIVIDSIEYELDMDASSYSKTSIEDLTTGVSYYDTALSYNAEYISSEDEEIIVSGNGNIYGYSQPWSKVETQTVSMIVMGDDWQITASVKPFLEAKKTIYYDETKPYAISFDGSYTQRFEREATLTYEITSTDLDLTEDEKSGSVIISTANNIEKLPIPENLDFIEGHWAEEDLKQLYSMGIYTEIPHEGMEVEAMPRGEFIKALCIAMDVDIIDYEDLGEEGEQVFGDVGVTHPLYPYIMAAYDNKLVKGVGEDFDVDVPITRQEAFVIYIRIIGLERLGVTDSPETPFVDDDEIASWAKSEIMAGYNLGIIVGDDKGCVNPNQWLSKVESAAVINRLISYLREDISRDYR
jgi:hypothetical protein